MAPLLCKLGKQPLGLKKRELEDRIYLERLCCQSFLATVWIEKLLVALLFVVRFFFFDMRLWAPICLLTFVELSTWPSVKTFGLKRVGDGATNRV